MDKRKKGTHGRFFNSLCPPSAAARGRQCFAMSVTSFCPPPFPNSSDPVAPTPFPGSDRRLVSKGIASRSNCDSAGLLFTSLLHSAFFCTSAKEIPSLLITSFYT